MYCSCKSSYASWLLVPKNLAARFTHHHLAFFYSEISDEDLLQPQPSHWGEEGFTFMPVRFLSLSRRRFEDFWHSLMFARAKMRVSLLNLGTRRWEWRGKSIGKICICCFSVATTRILFDCERSLAPASISVCTTVFGLGGEESTSSQQVQVCCTYHFKVNVIPKIHASSRQCMSGLETLIIFWS